MKTEKYDAIVFSSSEEKSLEKALLNRLKNAPLPEDELLANLGLFLTSKNMSRVLFFYEIYQKILHSHGIIIEFGVRWGQTLALMTAFRSIFEPFNRHRKIVGFDTFAGFKGIGKEDGERNQCQEGSFSVAPEYFQYLSEILQIHEGLNPAPHLKKFELVKGDATETVPHYFERHPETIVSLAIFDFDIYKPTHVALRAIQPHVCKGSILVFDELADAIFPGETLALREVMGLRNVKPKRLPMTSRVSYVEIE